MLLKRASFFRVSAGFEPKANQSFRPPFLKGGGGTGVKPL